MSIFILFLVNVKNISLSVIESLNFCYSKLIPSLYPFYVLSTMILYTTSYYGNNKVINIILDNCKIYANEILIGCICGFVVGAKGICKKFRNEYNEKDFNRAIFLSSNAGIGFVVGCIGGLLYNDILFGIYLYSIQIFSGFILFKFNREKDKLDDISQVDLPKYNILDIIVKAIKTSSKTILTICGFSIFFSTVYELIILIFKLKNNSFLCTIVQIILDFSKGTFQIFQLHNYELKSFLIGFCVGFGGICTYMQICSECESFPFEKFKFLVLKIIQGGMCGTFSLIYFKFLCIM